jgi:arginase family enzyme
MPGLTVLGVPTSAGAFAPGQERAPAALRAAGPHRSVGRRRRGAHGPRRLAGVALAPGHGTAALENTGRGEGLPLDVAMRALRVLTGSERLAALTVTELNPLHGDEEGQVIGRLVDGLTDSLVSSPALRVQPKRR